MNLKIVVKQGRGGRWRWYFQAEHPPIDSMEVPAPYMVAMCCGSFETNDEAMRKAQEIANADFEFEKSETVGKRPWYSWLFGR